MDGGQVVVDSIDEMALRDVTYELARESGFDSLEELLRTAKHGSGSNVYLVRFHYLPPGAWERRTVSHPARTSRRMNRND